MRDNRIDILRFLGLAGIIFAHIDTPIILAELRSFDVPLMVLVSGMSFSLSYQGNKSYLLYIWKRVKRLVFPLWIFLTLYFSIKLPFFERLPFKVIFETYALGDGIGYVWIIRVFLLVAILSPLLYSYNKSIDSSTKYILILSAFFCGYEVFRYLSLPYIQTGFGYTASLVIHYAVAYSLLFALGLRITSLDKSQMTKLSLINLLLFIVISIGLFLVNDRYIFLEELKNPPSIYYFSYSLFISSILWIYSRKIENTLGKLKLKSSILFIAQNSLWIYFWHIPIINIFLKLPDVNFVLEYLVVFSVSALITYCQIWIVNNVVVKHISNTNLSKNIKALLTG
jgi:hypothetical protein